MASQTPLTSKLDQSTRGYLKGWQALAGLMDTGASWSGNERNCVYLNLGEQRFANVSAITGLDFKDDARTFLATDWDEDGDLDLWLRNRSGPQVRLIENRWPASHHWIALRLDGGTINRDAIGAKVTISLQGRQVTRHLTAAGSYLSGASKTLHFGLGKADRIQRITVRWPNGNTELIAPPKVDQSYLIRAGSGQTETLAKFLNPKAPSTTNQELALSAPNNPGTRILLRTPLPIPPSLTAILTPANPKTKPHSGYQVLNLWASWCAPCRGELQSWHSEIDALAQAGLKITALNVDDPKDQSKAISDLKSLFTHSNLSSHAASPDLRSLTSLLLANIRGFQSDSLPLPISLLINPKGEIDLLTLGSRTPTELLKDIQTVKALATEPSKRSLNPGRWYFRQPRAIPTLARELRALGMKADAAFYQSLLKQ